MFLATPDAESILEDIVVTLIGTIDSKLFLKSLLSISTDFLNIIKNNYFKVILKGRCSRCNKRSLPILEM